MKKLLDIFQVLDNLSRIPRSGGILFAGIDPNRVDSIAEHSYKVTYICLLLGNAAKKRDIKVNVDKVVQAAITHDWTDSILLDIPSGSPSYKSYFDGEDLRGMVKKGEENAKKALEEYIGDITKLDLGESSLSKTEKKLLEIADLIALLIEILEWKYQGLKYEWFDYVWSNTLKRLKDNLATEYKFVLPLIAELKKAYKTGVKPSNPFLTKPEFQTHKK